MKKILLFLILISGLALHSGKLLIDSGEFRTIRSKGFSFCSVRASVPGPEDIEYSGSLKKFFVSSDTRPETPGEETSSGAIFTFSAENKEDALKVTSNLPFTFHPHGIALWEEDGNVRLFAINHRKEESTIEVFDWLGDRLEHVRTLSHELLIAPNDLVAVSAEELFISHDHGSNSRLLQAIEHFSRIGRGYLTHYDGSSFRQVETGIFFANGLAIDRPRNRLYLAATLEKAVRVFEVKPELKFLRSIPLDSGPDNLSIDDTGRLWAAAHPKLLALKAHSENHSKLAPSMVLKISDPDTSAAKAIELMEDDGRILSAASVALRIGSKIFLGAIYDAKIMECDRVD